jgi:L-Lysine epsilon oxidase N-terminal/von Willebrand factor type A domain
MPFKIHPGMGVARGGDSPTEWFIGPETADEPIPPPGGYKDNDCRIKRQGARFRIWQYDASGNALAEFTLAQGAIAWSVKLGTSATAITTISGPNQQAALPGSPSLGELRTDPEGRLIVLSGVIAGAFDARTDGWVKADVTPTGNPLEAAAGSWMVVGPPDYAPCIRPVLNVHARLQQFHIDNGMSIPVPASPSFLREIYPILKAGALSSPLDETNFPSLASQAERMTKANGFQVPNGPSVDPKQVTPTQRAMLDSWVAGSFTDDWASLGTPLPLTPTELDRGPISHCLQLFGAYECGPGIVAAGTPYVEPYRPDVNSVAHGFAVSGLLPWQSDASACVFEWPSQSTGGIGGGVDFWHTRGFVVRDEGGGTNYVEDCSGNFPYVMLLTHTVDFGDVAQAPGGGAAFQSAAIVFEVGSLTSALAFTVGALPVPALTSPVPSFAIGPLAPGAMETRRLWLTYQTGAVGSNIDVIVTVSQTGGITHHVRVLANTIAPHTTKLGFVLDASGSMNEDRGDGTSKLQGLKDAIDVAIDTAREDDGIGLAPYNQDALAPLAVTQLGPNVAGEPQRESVRTAKDALSAGGSTSIGDGITSGRTVLAGPALPPTATFDREALIVVTDGKENSPLFIADVASSIDQRTFAIGIGTPGNINVSTLQQLSGNTGGYLLLTGAVSGDNRYELQKYLLQILAEVNNNQIILDPTGVVQRGGVARIPFPVTEQDRMLEAIVLSDAAKNLRVALETPRGELIEPSTLGAVPGASYFAGAHEVFYRIDLPFPPGNKGSHGGRWALVLAKRGDDRTPVPYAAIVNTRSEVAFRVDARQTGHFVGADARVDAWLTQFGAPYEGSARVLAQWLSPSGARSTLTLRQEEQGHYAVRHILPQVGLHRIRVSADGRTPRGFVFKREATRTLFAGTSGASDPGNGGAITGSMTTLDCVVCRMLELPDVRRLLERFGIDPKALDACCHSRKAELEADRERELRIPDRPRQGG